MKSIILTLILLTSVQSFADDFPESIKKSLRENVMNTQKNPNNKPFIDYVAALEKVNNMKCEHLISEDALSYNYTDFHTQAEFGFSIQLDCEGKLPNGSKMYKNIVASGDYFASNSLIVKKIEVYIPEDDYRNKPVEASANDKKLLCESIESKLEKSNVSYGFTIKDCLNNKNIISTVVAEATLVVEGEIEFNAPIPRGKFKQNCSIAYVGTGTKDGIIQEAICE